MAPGRIGGKEVKAAAGEGGLGVSDTLLICGS